VIVALERRANEGLATVDLGVFWSLSMLTTMGFADVNAKTTLGRAFSVLWTVVAVVTISTFTSIISSKLTASTLAVGVVNALGDVRGTLCVEAAYPTAMSFVTRAPRRPASIVEAAVDECLAMLLNGSAAAVLTDRPVLAWFVANYGYTGVYVSPVLAPNPFSFVYPAGSALRQYVVRALHACVGVGLWCGHACMHACMQAR
jgi:ABC-type amino acid transport substrate-binding protein